jgi:hypothetical protein
MGRRDMPERACGLVKGNIVRLTRAAARADWLELALKPVGTTRCSYRSCIRRP